MTGLPWWLRQKRLCLQCGIPRFNPWVWKIPWGRAWQPASVFLPEKSHGERSLVVYSPWGCKESDTTEPLSRHTLNRGRGDEDEEERRCLRNNSKAQFTNHM